MLDISKLSIKSAREALKNKTFSSRELTEACLDAIKKKDGDMHAFLEVFDDVLKQADEADKRITNGEDTPLLGISIAIKDNILAEGKCATAGSKILKGFVSPYDSTAVKKLKSVGAIILGRTNMDEFALGSSTENSAYGVTRNPHDTKRVSGGTSGGSAASVASGMTLGALGSDTGGSVRQPAAFCGVVGLKPTYGSVSRNGLIAAVSSFDVIGTIAKTVTDAQTIFNVIKGQDDMDSTSMISNTHEAVGKKSKMKIGVPWGLIEGEGIESEVKENLKNSVKKFEDLGFEIKNIELPNCLAIYYIINFAEVSSNLARFDGVKYGLHVGGKDLLDDYLRTRGEGFGREVRRRILLGTYVLSAGYYDAYYSQAQIAQTALKKEFEKIFTDIDLLLTPTTPAPAWKIGEKNDPLAMYLEDIFTVTANIIGLPAISIPSGFVGDLPLGIQMTADLRREDNLFIAGKEFLGE